jgi:hypothetical protein
MKQHRIVKSLAISAISALTLLSGISQAEGWGYQQGHYQRAYAPNPYLQPAPFYPGHRDRLSDDARRAFEVDARQREQMDAIMRGLRNGVLSRFEGKKLMHEQRNIEDMQREFLSDRHLSRNEWATLDRMLDRAERNIRAEKRDNNRR